VASLRGDGVPVRLVSRSADRRREPRPGVSWHDWDGCRPDASTLAGARGVVHLAGEPLFGGLPTAARRQRIRDSRVDSTTEIADTLAALPAERRPRVFVCASAVGYYGDRGEELLDEGAAPGDGFLADLCREWEEAAARAAEAGVRVVSLRIGIVLAAEGGALAGLAPLFKLGLGGPVASGRQWMPWIHVDDLVALIRHALDEPSLAGPVNAVAPGIVRNEAFTRALARQVSRPAFLRVPAFALRAALGELAGELVGSRRVVARRALDSGFHFRHERLESALAAELG
jgi:hypothetical protein